MARRRSVRREDVTALARRALDEVAAAEDRSSAADRVLSAAPAGKARQAIVELSIAAPDDVTASLVSAAVGSGDEGLARVGAELLIDIRRSPQALGILDQCMAVADPLVRRRATEALESMSDPAAVDLLTRALSDEADSVRSAATGALGLIIGIRQHPLRDHILQELSDPGSGLTRAILGAEDRHEKRRAVESLSFGDSDAVLPALAVLGRDEDEGVRQEVALCLDCIGTESAVEAAKAMLDDPSYRVVSALLGTLAARLGADTDEFFECLERAMAHPSVEVRRHAVLMLSQFAEEDAGPVLRAAVLDDDFEVARRAGELLRELGGDADVSWLEGDMAAGPAGGRVAMVWEAGNLGLEAADEGRARLVPLLEKAVREGAATERVHALGELAGLADVADSPAMQDAFNDPDPSVRSRAADTLQYSRGAGFIARVLRTHPDGQIRRRAMDALAADPGGPAQAGPRGSIVDFVATRTVGMALFGHVLKALDDADDGVRQQACAALRAYAQVGVLPMRQTEEALDRLAGDPDATVLLQDDATHALESVRVATLPQVLTEQVDGVLEWRGQVAREAHAVAWQPAAHGCVVDQAVGAEALERWVADYGLSDEDAGALRSAVSEGKGLPDELGRQVLTGLARDLRAALNSVAFSAGALGRVAPEDAPEVLARWADAVATGPTLNWGEDGKPLLARLRRLRRKAWIEAVAARAYSTGESPAESLAEAAADEDDWVKLTTLCAAAAGKPSDHLPDRILALCREHGGRRDYRDPIGRAALVLLRAGAGSAEQATQLLPFVLGGSRIDRRMALTSRMMDAALDDAVADRLAAFVATSGPDELPAVCAALALRGAGRKGDRPAPAPEAGGEWDELLCARLALRAMDNDPEATARLEACLREGEVRPRCAAAQYLSLARVRSAAQVFASVVDQSGVPFVLRGICVGALLRAGHAAWRSSAVTMGRSARGRAKADLTTHLARAVEDVIPLMLQCGDVDVGRFV